MASIYDFLTPKAEGAARPLSEALAALESASMRADSDAGDMAATGRILSAAWDRQTSRMVEEHGARARDAGDAVKDLGRAFGDEMRAGTLDQSWRAYLRDAQERTVLTLDTLRRRGDIFLEHEAAGCPPVLIYDYEVIVDGRDLLHPSNYMLLRILPPDGVTIDETKQPFMIIDPRAGHGPGIGGFKIDSQVGVALRGGHPVYFVAFRSMPEPGQYISHVTRAEATFVREIQRRHPGAPNPVVTGNCQGGWATLLLAATNPDITGPIVINGAPVAPWAGKVGENPMRYNAGVLGGTWLASLSADLGGGIFDGAALVQNFEMLNPSRTLYRKYTDLYHDVDDGADRFLDFERWWGGYFLMNEPEIRWITEQLFIGNRLVKNEARLEPGRPVDIKNIRAPIIVFASHGDNITPPQQALNWIAETYADAEEIRVRGQRIVYMVHEQVGHLGIFVSSSVARKEHSEMATTLDTIASLPPGLYEMKIERFEGDVEHRSFVVSLAERSLDDIRALDDGVEDERPFAAVARMSEMQSQAYDLFLRPWVQAAVTPAMAQLGRTLHPNRVQRAAFATKNPVMAPVEAAAERVRDNRQPATKANPFVAAEHVWVEAMTQAIDLWRDQRDLAYELTFHSLWGTPWARFFGRNHEMRRTLKDHSELRTLPEVSAALARMSEGGFAEAVVRILVLLADNRGGVRRTRLERSNQVLQSDEPFASLTAVRRTEIIHEQSLISTYEPEMAIVTLADLLRSRQDRVLAMDVAQYIAGSIDEMTPATRDLFDRLREALDLPPMQGDIHVDPLAASDPAPRSNGAATSIITAEAPK
ncbi:MAG: DUF3141 domain-containing protein [Marinibacterium sp.]|nr:DUF3141 domain-containing protein [Marinibacterium sp.]